MSDSDVATLNSDLNGVGGIESSEQLREKWKRAKVKTEDVAGDLLQEKKLPEKILGLQNGVPDSGLLRGKSQSRVPKGLSGVDLGHPQLSSPQKTAKLQAQKTVKQRMQTYCCVSCKGKSFSTYLNFHRHLLSHISLPEVKLTRLSDEEDDCEDLEVVSSGRLQVARKRITLSCHNRSPLKFRLMCTNSNDKKDSFKLVKSSIKGTETPDNADALRSSFGSVPERLLNSSSAKSGGEIISGPEVNTYGTVVIDDQKSSPLRDCDKEGKGEDWNPKKSEENPLGDAPSSSKQVFDCNENAEASSSTSPKVKDSLTTPAKVNESSFVISAANDPSPAPPEVNESTATPSKSTEEQGVDETTMRQMKNVESEMEKMQSKSPSVIQSTLEARQVASDKNGLSSSSETECEALHPEFIPIERLEKDGPPPLISAAVNSMVQSALSSQEGVSESRILCEACGETIIGDQTALEDHCLCRGHYKCPICSVACASTDALAVHSKESHPNADLTAHLHERKKKSSLRSVRPKHAETSEKDVSRDSLSDLSNSPSIPSPSADIRTPPLPSPTSVRASDPIQNTTPVRPRNEVVSGTSRVQEQDARRNSASSAGSAVPTESPQAANSYPTRGGLQQAPQSRLPPGRVSDTMPPPLMRPPNIRSNETQPRSMANVPMQAPPALYKVPTSHAMSNSQPTAALPTVPGAAYIRGIPASGYQPDPQSSAVANPFSASASSHLAASAAALNARYQTMHHGYPPGSQPQPGYAAYTQPMQTQQRYQMPPPPYPNQLPPHLQQNPRAAMMPQNTYAMSSPQQAYNQSLLKAQLEQARLQLPQPSSMLQSMQNLQQEHYQQQQLQQQQLQQQQLQQQQQQQLQQQQLQQQLFQQPHHQLVQQSQQDQIRGPAPTPQQIAQKRKSSTNNSSNLRYHHQAALQNQQQIQSQLQQSPSQPPVKQRRAQSIGIPSKQTDSDCEIIAVQQRGEGVPVIQSIQGANASPTGDSGGLCSDSSSSSASASVPTSSESTIHLTDSITLSVRQPPGGASGNKGHSANAVASILATRGITVTPASGASPSRTNGGQRARPSPPPSHAQAPSSPNQNSPGGINSAISISHSSRPQHQANEGFAVPAPVAAPRPAPRQAPPTERPPRPPTVDLTDENAHSQNTNSVVTCRLCDKQFPSLEALQQHMHVIHQTRNYFRCSICNTKHPSQQALSNHIKRVHKFGGVTGSPPELVIPLVDLKNTGAMARLSGLGVNYVISLNQLGMSPDSNTFCIPIMSLDASGQARNNSISGLMSLGTSAVLPIGPVKSVPAAQQHSQQPQSQPQTVPSLSQGNVNLGAPPPGAPMRAPPLQYAQPMGQAVPR